MMRKYPPSRKRQQQETFANQVAKNLNVWLHEERDKEISPAAKLVYLPIVNALNAPAMPYAVDEIVQAFPGTVSTATFATRIALPFFRLGQSSISIADAHWGRQYPVLHAFKRMLDAATPGAITFIFTLKDIGQIVMVTVLGDSTGKVIVSNSIGGPILSAAAIIGLFIWFFNTGIVGQILERYLHVEENNPSKTKKALTNLLRTLRILAKTVSYSSVLGILTLLIIEILNLSVNIPLLSLDSQRKERMLEIVTPAWVTGVIIGGVSACCDEFNVKRAPIRYLYLSLNALALTTMTILNDHQSFQSDDTSENYLAIADLFSLGMTILLPFFVLLFVMLYKSLGGGILSSFSGESSVNNSGFATPIAVWQDQDEEQEDNLDSETTLNGSDTPALGNLSDDDEEEEEQIPLSPKSEKNWFCFWKNSLPAKNNREASFYDNDLGEDKEEPEEVKGTCTCMCKLGRGSTF